MELPYTEMGFTIKIVKWQFVTLNNMETGMLCRNFICRSSLHRGSKIEKARID
jgi:hypothetical protein